MQRQPTSAGGTRRRRRGGGIRRRREKLCDFCPRERESGLCYVIHTEDVRRYCKEREKNEFSSQGLLLEKRRPKSAAH